MAIPDSCIYEGYIVVIDKSLQPEHRDLVIRAIDGEFNAARILRL
jgi:DNA polymerase V